jgi:hypothetical protein
VDKKWKSSSEPIARISPKKEWFNDSKWVIPPVNESTTTWQKWPSGSFRCNEGTIGTPWFLDCYNSQSFKGISQHTIDFPNQMDIKPLNSSSIMPVITPLEMPSLLHET